MGYSKGDLTVAAGDHWQSVGTVGTWWCGHSISVVVS